jgi:PAS domain S-box-containing protein
VRGYAILETEYDKCLGLCERLQPSLVILSSAEPHGDSFALCECIRSTLENPPAILMILDTVSSACIDHALKAGADDYITRPVDASLLERRLKSLSVVPVSKRTQEITLALHDYEQRYKTLFDNAPISIFSKDLEGRYTSSNAYNMTYFRNNDPTGHTDFELFSTDTAEILRATDLRVIESGHEIEVEETIPTEQGIRTVLSRKAPLRNTAGEIEGVLGISEDITEQKEVEKALQESIEQFQALFQYSPDAIFLIEPEYPSIIVDCNEVACRMNGYTREELVGHSVMMLDVDGSFEVPLEGMSYTGWLRSKGHVQFEMKHRRKDGTEFPIEVSTCLVTIGGRELILGIDRDITERNQMESAERKQRILAEALRDTAFVLNSTLDLDEVLDRILIQAARVVPYETASIGLIENGYVHIVRCRGFAERGLEEVALASCFPVAGHTHYTRMITTLNPVVVEDVRSYEGWYTDSEVDWIRGHVATPIIVQNVVIGFLHLDSSEPSHFTQEDGRNLQFFASHVAIAIQNARYTDELERRVREHTAELRSALIRERELSELKTRFLTMASHEFRTPMSIMMTSSELLRNYYDRMSQEQRVERLVRIQGEVKYMTTLLEDILKVNRTVDNNPKQLTPEPLDVALFCRNLLESKAYTQTHPIEFILGQDCGIAMLDSNLLTDILTSLLSNAVKYSKSDQLIRLQVDCNDDQILFIVQDYGIGIPKEDQERIFEVFHRGRNVDHISGTGLGLTIAKQSAELHGGKLSFTSEVGIGTTFTLTIPKDYLKEFV